MAKLLYGKPVAESIYSEISNAKTPLKVATIGLHSPQWQQYAEALVRTAEKCGVTVQNIVAEGKTPAELADIVREASARRDLQGIVLQQPLPVEYASVAEQIAAEKDIDCISSASVAKLYKGEGGFQPATPLAVLKLLDFYGVDLCGKNVVIVGRGNAVGKPLALMCLKRNATVTVCHTKTVDLAAVCRRADVLISACGVAGLITKDFVTEKSIVVDVGLSFVEGKTCGDVAEEVQNIVQAVSPVPGGVGPVTRAALLQNLMKNK